MSENHWGKNAIELHYADCEHTRFIPRGHTGDHQHCYACNPELAKNLCPDVATIVCQHASVSVVQQRKGERLQVEPGDRVRCLWNPGLAARCSFGGVRDGVG